MAVPVSNVISTLRVLVADTTVPYRWSDDILLDRVNDALTDLFTRRPDASPTPFTDLPDPLLATDNMSCLDRFVPAARFHAAALLLQERASDKSLRKQGEDFMKTYTEYLGV
jgi:hypothetical protein